VKPLFGSLCLVLGLAGSALLAQSGDEDAPLSAIDWLSDTVRLPAETAVTDGPPGPGTRATRIPPEDEAPVTQGAGIPDVTVLPLGRSSPDRIGLLPTSVTGLPRDLWSGSDVAVLEPLMRAEPVDTLPALRQLLTMVLLAEAEPPLNAGPDGALFLARVDKLLDFGTLDPAQSLLEAADPDTPELFRRWFDVSLLTGTEDAACEVLQSRPTIAPTPSARIFCLARSGDWSTAALTLNTARVLGDIDPETAQLMERFLDPELFEGEAALPPPSRPSPLDFRLREAIGEGLNTTALPRAFAHADLRGTVGWKSQLEAAERLARTGAISSTTLHGLRRLPATATWTAP